MANLGGAVFEPALSALLEQLETLDALSQDQAPLPSTDSRFGQFEDRHLEFWLSGRLDSHRIRDSLSLQENASVLDLRGWGARIVRHLVRDLPDAQFFVGEQTGATARLMRASLGERVTTFVTPVEPRLPFPDATLDAILAVSFFPFLEDEMGWLLELRRVLKPNGLVYATVYDDATWSSLPQWFAGRRLLADPEFRAYHQQHPTLSSVVTTIESASAGHIVFRPRSYLDTVWSRFFSLEKVNSLAHGEQAAVIMKPASHPVRAQANIR